MYKWKLEMAYTDDYEKNIMDIAIELVVFTCLVCTLIIFKLTVFVCGVIVFFLQFLQF